MVASVRHRSSLLGGGQYGLERSLKVVMKEEVSHSAKVCFLGQSVGLGPLLMLLTVPEGHAERALIFLADAPLAEALSQAVDCQSHPLTLSHSRSDRVGKPRATPQLVASDLELSPVQLAL